MCSGSLASYIVTLLGCCYRCLHCNAYRISQYPDPGWQYAGYVPAAVLVAEARERIAAYRGRRIRTIGFTGGDPIIHLPYIEEVAAEVKRQGLDLGIGISTGGFATEATMERIVDLCRVITLEIKAWSDPVHRALDGSAGRSGAQERGVPRARGERPHQGISDGGDPRHDRRGGGCRRGVHRLARPGRALPAHRVSAK